jgi:tetratricopeptide (TPR) repeat protein
MGYAMQLKDGTEAALDFYLSGIRCTTTNFPCVYNLACVYATLQKHTNALKWFNVAIKIDPNSMDAYYGSALSSFKMKRFQEAFDNLKNMPATA